MSLVFISHAAEDANPKSWAVVDQLRESLCAAGLSPYEYRAMAGTIGQRCLFAMLVASELCDLAIVLLDERARESKWVRFEQSILFQRAAAGAGLRLLIISEGERSLDSVSAWLKNIETNADSVDWTSVLSQAFGRFANQLTEDEVIGYARRRVTSATLAPRLRKLLRYLPNPALRGLLAELGIHEPSLLSWQDLPHPKIDPVMEKLRKARASADMESAVHDTASVLAEVLTSGRPNTMSALRHLSLHAPEREFKTVLDLLSTGIVDAHETAPLAAQFTDTIECEAASSTVFYVKARDDVPAIVKQALRSIPGIRMHRIVQLHSYGGTFHDLVDQLNATIVQTLMIDPQDAHLGAELQKLRKFGTALFVVVDSFPGGDRDVHALTSLFPDLTFVLTGPEATQGLSAKMFTPLRLGGEAFDRLEMREHIRFLEMDLDFDRL